MRAELERKRATCGLLRDQLAKSQAQVALNVAYAARANKRMSRLEVELMEATAPSLLQLSAVSLAAIRE